MINSTTKADQTATESSNTPTLPTEIWLQILEHDDIKHLWLSVRNISRAYRDCVERLFSTKYLHRVSITLSLPQRDLVTNKLKWPGDPIPTSQLVMAYARLSEDGKRLRLESSTVVKDGYSEKTLEELREAGSLPKERLEEALTTVNMSTHPMAGLTIKLSVRIDWDETRKVLAWDVEWRSVLSRFLDAKDRQGKIWPTTVWDTVPRGLPWRSDQAHLA
ncbi:hypothetical protein BU25DRAFT_428372 [Macroventuria anomochaeta]|uniref:Uncharacterized protein n=1 Tax=Macroventuria anomochaeta TaxID=301207 RepID=A0ACB6SBM9_9PLEO|nr:uncharacterized protein BU25DRAFT_428372 [Macroventuria anomochaeta]KAF2631413.1 hypothetical protein BU25DRAFT_428372 [Macroventuria anomochaeta]